MDGHVLNSGNMRNMLQNFGQEWPLGRSWEGNSKTDEDVG